MNKLVPRINRFNIKIKRLYESLQDPMDLWLILEDFTFKI